MKPINPKNEDEVRALVSGAVQWPNPPWNLVLGSCAFYEEVCRDICDEFGLISRIEANSYGCGYASFVDAWFYKNNAEFKAENPHESGQAFTGLFILLCETAPFYALGEGQKSWSGTSGSSYLPTADMVDEFSTQAVMLLSIEVEQFLSERGMTRLMSSEIMEPIPAEIAVETNLSDGELKMFDAYFHWMD
ncbi:MAG: hypothetical protein AB3N22_07170 [Ruegeria sp.]